MFEKIVGSQRAACIPATRRPPAEIDGKMRRGAVRGAKGHCCYSVKGVQGYGSTSIWVIRANWSFGSLQVGLGGIVPKR